MKMNIWINWRFKMWSKRNKLWCMQLINLFFILLMLADLTCASQSTLEKIKKHQEWLRQRNLQQQQQQSQQLALSSYIQPYDLANLWRFPNNKQSTTTLPMSNQTPMEQQQQQQQQHQKQNLEKPSSNDVYPENDVLIVTTMMSNVINNTTATTTTTTPITTTTTTTTMSTNTNNTIPPPPPPPSNTMPTERAFDTTTTITRVPPAPTSVLNTTTIVPLLVTNNPNRIDVVTVGRTSNEQMITKPTTTTTETPFSISNTTKTTTAPITTLKPTNRKTMRKPNKTKPRQYPRWGNWSKWSDCSRACGGGVMYQQRKCINRNSSTGKRYVSNDCVGIYRRYQMCNDQPCANGDLDFRAEQCAAFNEEEFQDRKYFWEPYIKEDAECELNCKPVGMKYFATLNATVIDGTSCYRPAEYYRSNYRNRAICVGGICKYQCLQWEVEQYAYLHSSICKCVETLLPMPTSTIFVNLSSIDFVAKQTKDIRAALTHSITKKT